MPFFAHSNSEDTSNWQTVREHVTNTAQIAHELGQDARLSDFAYLAAMMHDIGKYSQAFQNRLHGATFRVDHATAGAYELVNLFNANPNQHLIAQLLSYCVAGHHGGLPDFGSVTDTETEPTLCGRLKRNLEDYHAYRQEIDPQQIPFPAALPIKPLKNYPAFSISFLTRMIYSILVDADFQETETFMNGGKKPRGGYPSIETLNQTFNQFLARFDAPQNPINRKRTEILKNCIARASDPQGFFSLTVPTGGGKTFASMAFALNHAAAHGLKRIIYVIPYTSIIEQNAAEFKKCLGEENVLEHHANFDWEKQHRVSQAAPFENADEKTISTYNKLKLAAENWDIPLVVTTNVQFFESLFASRSSRCRKLHNLAKSVLIFDEAQMLPREYLKPCMYSVVELVKNYGASAVFCTATQPALHKILPQSVRVSELMPAPRELYHFFKRVRVEQIGRLTDAQLIQRIQETPRVLCIVNTRKHARGLFTGLNAEGVFHLSALMCPAHRKKTIQTIRERLKNGLPCRVISTQIMEAGIDLDFPVGFRAVAGLDSIIQAAGRVNREGKQASACLYVFQPDSEYARRLPAYIQQGADVSRSILRNFAEDPISQEAIAAYFESLYNLADPNAFDSAHILNHFEKGLNQPSFDFRSAAEKFKIVEENTRPVIIPYDNQARAWIDELRGALFPVSVLRKLQSYTVNIYESDYKALSGVGYLDPLNENCDVLIHEQSYDKETGLIIPEDVLGKAIFY